MLTAAAAAPNDQLAPGAIARRRLALATLGLLAVATWVLEHSYTGIIHDATLYALFALSKLHPDQLASDVFLRFGSQDRYTLFTPIYAAAIDAFGLERAASLLTLIFQGGLLLSAWLLGRRFMPPLAALLGAALLVAVPGEYGSADTLHIMEGFLTPRLPAEALAVGALVAGLGQRYWIAAVCVVCAMSLHPIIGCAGAAMLILTFVAPLRPKWVAAIGIVTLAVAIAVALAVTPVGRLEGTWLYTVRISSSYLFLETWSSNDWSRVCTPLAILAIGALTGTTTRLRRVCTASLVMVAVGLLITFIFSDLLHVSIFIAAQTWRWLWLANVIALVLVPVIAEGCWRRGDSGRIAILVLISAWIFRGMAPTLYLVPLAIVCAAVPERWTQHRNWRWILRGACVLVGVGLILELAGSLSGLPKPDPAKALLPQSLRAICADGVIPAGLLIAAWLTLRRAESTARVAAIAALAVLTCATLLPLTWGEWTGVHYRPELVRQFAPWRAAIPARAEILWPDSPIGSWYLLDRPNYWSRFQMAGAIFSRSKALLLTHRAEVVAQANQKSNTAIAQQVPQHSIAGGEPEATARIDLAGMKWACADPDLSYVVSWLPLAPTPYPPVSIASLNRKLYLYRCAALLQDGGPHVDSQ